MHMLHCNKPQRKSPEGLRTDDEYVQLLYVYAFYCICIGEDPSVVFFWEGDSKIVVDTGYNSCITRISCSRVRSVRK